MSEERSGRAGQHGITLIELVLVVSVMAILAVSVAYQQSRVIERSRASEALAYLGALRAAEMRSRANNPTGAYTSQLADLDIVLPASFQNWTGLTLSAPATTGLATVARSSGMYGGQTVGIQYGSGTICGTFTPMQPLPACVAD